MKTGVVGLGLIGGSIFKGLIQAGYDVVGVSKSQEGDNIYKTYDILTDCDVVFVCSPMNRVLNILDDLEHFLHPETIVTDVCSLKEFVCKKHRPYNFIPSHPMAGTERQGFENSFPELFRGARWAITPYYDTVGIEVLETIIKRLGAKPVITTSEEHDEAVALISHMPMVISQALFAAARDNSLALELASSGFRDMTRLAMSNTEMAEDMVSMNSGNIEHAILKLYRSVGDLITSDYPEKIEKIKVERSKMFKN